MRRALKICAWVMGGLALLTLTLGGALFVAGNTDAGRAMIENVTHRLTSGHVSLSGLGGSFPEHLTIEHLQLSDDRGVWLRAERVSLDWSAAALLARRLQIYTLSAATVDMERLPEASSSAHRGEDVSIPRIDVGDMKVDLLRLGPRLAGAPASLQLRGNAHLRSVRDMLVSATAHRIDGDSGGGGGYALQLRFDPKRMDAALTLHEPAGGPLENLLQLPGLGALAATVNLNGPRAAERLELSIDAGALRGRAQGTLNLEALSADLDFAFDSPALTPRPGLAWEHASVHGRWHGSVKAPRADGHIEVDQLRLPGGTQLASVVGDFTADSGAGALHALVGGLRIGPQPKLLEDSPVKIDAVMRLDAAARPLDVSASHRLFSLHASAETAETAGRRNASFELRLPDLSPLAAIGGQHVRGSALIQAQLHDDAKATHVTLDASAALRVGAEIWSGAVGDRATLQLSGTLTDRSIALESMKFTGHAASLAASGEVSRPPTVPGSQAPRALRAQWDLNVWDLKSLSPAVAGTLRASGSMNGPITALVAEAQLESTLSVRDSPSGTLSAAIKVRGLPSSPSGTFAAQGLLDGAPVHVDVAVERAPSGVFRALIHRADWKSAHADGDIDVAPATMQTHGQMRLAVGQLADLRDLLGMNVAGSLAGTVALHPDQGRTQAQLHLDARDLAAGQFIGNAQLSAEGAADALGFKLDLQIPNLRGAAASLSASGSFDLQARAITVTGAVANYHGQDAHLLSPARIALANGVSVDALRIGAQKAVLQLDGEVLPALDVRASLRQVQPSIINVFAPGLLASGTIEAQAQLQGRLASPTGRVELSATGVSLADDAAFGLPPLDLHGTAQLTGATATIDAQLVAGTASRLSVTGQAPLGVDGALDLKISGNLDVGTINPLLEARGQHAAGELKVDATVAGSVAAPRIDGTVNLAQGSVRDYGRGLSLTDITAAIVGSEGTLQIKSLTAAAAPGTVSMTGMVGVLKSGIPVDLKIKADNAQPLVSKLVTANLDADLHVTGTARARLDIEGSVHLNRTLIGIPNGLPPNVAVLDVRRRGKTVTAVPDKQLAIGLDVTVHAPQEILVQGRGLDAEMGGELHVSGTTDAPLVSGGFDLQRGSFSLAGSNKLNFTAGRVSFNGAGLKYKIDPTLDFTAQTTVADATATLRITGLADAPQFEFTSNPAKPQDEIMSLLLFGVPASQLSGLQLAQVGVTLATLSGVGGDSGLNPLVKLQRSLGLDRLTVGPGATNPGIPTGAGTQNSGASIEAGRYISKRIYIEAKQSTAGTSQFEADVDLTKHLKLQTRLGNGTASVQGTTPENDPGSSVGLLYQFEY
jgi:translocation and assembly module TamB